MAGNLTNGTGMFKRPENMDSKLFEFIPLMIIGILIIAVNGMLCWLFCSREQIRRKPENGLFCSQTCGNLLNIIFIIMHILEEMRLIPRILPFLTGYLLFLDLFGLFALTFDRYWAFTRPLQRRSRFSKRLLAVEVLLIWILPLAPSLIEVLHPKEENLHKILYCLMVVVLSVFFAVLIILHVAVYLKVRKIKQKGARTRSRANATQFEVSVAISGIKTAEQNDSGKQLTLTKEIKLAKMTFIMLILYLFGHLPIIYLNLADSFGRWDLVNSFSVQFSLYSFLLNSVFNALMCIFVKCDFKSAFYDSLKCVKCQCQVEE